jgi:anaerobic selenocysteine-containing dehydrogenase
VAPLGESKGEWEICALLARRIAERARERGVAELASLYERFTLDGRFGPADDEALLDHILRESPVTGGKGLAEARERGALPIATAGGWGTTSGIGSDVEPGGTLAPSRVHVEGKHPWPTLTGRQQFYLDHPWFFEYDEVLPRWKPLPRVGGAHRILLTGGHTRWSIHAIWRAHPDLLRLQRGGPLLWMSVEDARGRKIRDGDRVRVWNDLGAFQVAAKVSPIVAPGEAIIYHAWEPYQFPGRLGNMEVVASPYKPLHFVGDYGHLRYRVFQAGPVHVPRGVGVEIEKCERAADAAGTPHRWRSDSRSRPRSAC